AIAALPVEAARNLLREGQFNVLPGSAASPWSADGSGTVLVGSNGYVGSGYAGAPSVRLRSEAGQWVQIQQCVSVDLPAGTELAFSLLGHSETLSGGEGSVEASFVWYDVDVCGSSEPLPIAILNNASVRGLQPGRFGERWSVEPL